MALVGWEFGDGLCRSELARDDPKNAAGCQASRVIVDDHRDQARSYREGLKVRRKALAGDASTDSSAVANSTDYESVAAARG